MYAGKSQSTGLYWDGIHKIQNSTDEVWIVLESSGEGVWRADGAGQGGLVPRNPSECRDGGGHTWRTVGFDPDLPLDGCQN